MYEELLREKRKKSALDAAGQAAMSGAVTGGGLGAITHLLGSGKLSKAGLLKSALTGAGLYGGLAGGSTYVGTGLLGSPAEDDPTAYSRRAGLGGALLGGAAGAGLGALAAKGKFKIPVPILEKFMAKLAPKQAAAAGALGLGAAGAYLGTDEGMQADFLAQESRRRRREALMEALGEQ